MNWKLITGGAIGILLVLYLIDRSTTRVAVPGTQGNLFSCTQRWNPFCMIFG